MTYLWHILMSLKESTLEPHMASKGSWKLAKCLKYELVHGKRILEYGMEMEISMNGNFIICEKIFQKFLFS